MGEDFLEQTRDNSFFFTVEGTQKALDSELERVNTVQPLFCCTIWFLKGYRLFVHMLDRKTVEIKLGKMNETSREIRVYHNLEKMLLSNEFGLATMN